MKVNRRLRNVKGADMKIFQTPSYDRFCLFEMERKSKDFRGMDDNVAYKNKQIDNVEISNEGRRALREKLREVKPKVEEPIGYELTIQDTGGKYSAGFARYDYALRNYKDVYTGASKIRLFTKQGLFCKYKQFSFVKGYGR